MQIFILKDNDGKTWQSLQKSNASSPVGGRTLMVTKKCMKDFWNVFALGVS